MGFKKEDVQNPFLFDTKIENIFISEYIISAPGDYVKVFLVASMYAEMGKALDKGEMGRFLSMEETVIDKAWVYWEGLGVAKKTQDGIRIVSLKENLFSKKTKTEKYQEKAKEKISSATLSLLENEPVKNMYSQVEKIIGRPLTGTETSEITNWIKEFSPSLETITYAYAYAAKKQKANIRYVGTVVRAWTTEGLTSVLDIEKHLGDNDERHYVYRRIMQALGFSRNATEEEKRVIDRWVDDMSFAIDEILDACKKTTGISNPNINYINSILKAWNKGESREEKSLQPTPTNIQKYYKHIREEAEASALKRKEEIHQTFPEISRINDKIRALGMDIAKEMVSGGASKLTRIESIKKEIKTLNAKHQKILTEKNIPVDYTEVKYRCMMCSDTGTKNDGQKCQCYKERAAGVSEWLKSQKK